MAEAGDHSRKCIGEILVKIKRWIVLGGLWGALLVLVGVSWAEESITGRGPARNRPARISNKYSEYKRLTRYFFYNDGVLDSQERVILKRLQERIEIKPEEGSRMIQDVETNLDFPAR